METKERKDIAKRDYYEKIKDIDHWNRIDKMFKKMKKKKRTKFTYTFEHSSDIFSNYQPDDEWKIEIYAEKNGYEIIDEELRPTKSIYTFQLK